MIYPQLLQTSLKWMKISDEMVVGSNPVWLKPQPLSEYLIVNTPPPPPPPRKQSLGGGI